MSKMNRAQLAMLTKAVAAAPVPAGQKRVEDLRDGDVVVFAAGWNGSDVAAPAVDRTVHSVELAQARGYRVVVFTDGFHRGYAAGETVTVR